MTHWIISAVLIGCAVLAKFFPGILAGYNTLSKEEKNRVDVRGLTTAIIIWSILQSGAIVGLHYLCSWKDAPDAYETVFRILLLIFGSVAMAIFGSRYFHNRNGRP